MKLIGVALSVFWVLWVQDLDFDLTPKSAWSTLRTFDFRVECMREAHPLLQARFGEGTVMDPRTYGHKGRLIFISRGAKWEFDCLPDAVQPNRGQ